MLAVVFVAVGIAELAVLAAVESRIGLAGTLLLVVATGVAGAFLMSRQGLGVWRAFQADLQRGIFPGRRLAEGVLVLVAGALLFAPGFITDSVGLLLMAPPVRREVIRRGGDYLRRRLRLS
ncbi:MAG: FxsA family protein [Acidimicrobiia bacterium]